MQQKIKLVISDFHLGSGRQLPTGGTNFLEDFFQDDRFVEFLEYHTRGRYEKARVELVINGDFFNHLQVFPDEPRPTILDEEVVLERTKAIVSGHQRMFEALSRFASAPNHSVVFVIGNHDIGLFWPSVREYVVQVVGPACKVHRHSAYIDERVWIEHGNQQVAENSVDYESPFIEIDGCKQILNLPWGAIFVIKFLNKMKHDRPYVDKVYPFRTYLRWALSHDRLFVLKATRAAIVYFLQVFLRLGENRRFSRQHYLKILKEFSFPVRMDRAAKRVFALNPEMRIVVFGHGHRAAEREFAGGKRYFNTGIWNEMINLGNPDSGRYLSLTYVEIECGKDGEPVGSLKEWK